MSVQEALFPESASLRRALVESLRANRVLRSPSLEQAFLTIPREVFVPSFYERDGQQSRMAWKQLDALHMAPEHYLALVYRDEPLVTHLDERGWPISSSSLPSVMARMLEALDVQPGMRVLEIGTGTGYNAALLARLTGDAQLVTTIEVDAHLSEQAALALEQVIGPGVCIQVGDGFAGCAPRAPYERMIATASVPVLPRAWIEQLALGGKLVMDLQGSLASGFLVVEKRVDHQGASGSFLPQPLYFMPLKTEELPVPGQLAASERLLQQPRCEHKEQEASDPFPNVLKEPSFRWLLQWWVVGCQIHEGQSKSAAGHKTRRIVVSDPSSQTMIRFQQQEEEHWHVSVHGKRSLWQQLQEAYHSWVDLGRPGPEAYCLVIDEAGKTTLLISSLTFSL